ncbi:MAG: SPOR domain-containing protein, partial [Bacteroidetes bacterium]
TLPGGEGLAEEETLATGDLPGESSERETEGPLRGTFDAYNQTVSIAVLDTAGQRPVAEPTPEQPRTPRRRRTYHLIGASFGTQRGAERYVQERRAEGYDPVILFPPEGSSMSYRVALFSHTDRRQVEAFAERLRRQGKKTGWIFEEIPKP